MSSAPPPRLRYWLPSPSAPRGHLWRAVATVGTASAAAQMIRARVDLLMRRYLGRDFTKIFTNVSWLMAERVLNLTISFGLTVWLARYLGPADFGLYSYVIAFVSLFGFLTILGLDGIGTRDLVLHPESKDRIIGTTLALRTVGALAGAALITLIAQIHFDEAAVRLYVILVASGMMFEAFAVVDTWFNSKTEARYSVIARSITLGFSAFATAALLSISAGLIAFLALIPLRQAIKAACFALMYRYDGNSLTRLRHDWSLAKGYLRQSWPLTLSFASALVYLKIDQVMLGSMLDNASVGIYSAASRLSEGWYFLGPTIAISVFPSIIEAKRRSLDEYRNRLQRLYTMMAWLAIAIAVVVTIAAEALIDLLYASQFAPASAVLAIHIWTCPVVFMGAILNKWLINERYYTFALTRNLLGAASNVALNLLLIPRIGVAGSALATLLSYSVAHYLACFTDVRTRPAGIMMTLAMFGPLRILRARNFR